MDTELVMSRTELSQAIEMGDKAHGCSGDETVSGSVDLKTVRKIFGQDRIEKNRAGMIDTGHRDIDVEFISALAERSPVDHFLPRGKSQSDFREPLEFIFSRADRGNVRKDATVGVDGEAKTGFRSVVDTVGDEIVAGIEVAEIIAQSLRISRGRSDEDNTLGGGIDVNAVSDDLGSARIGYEDIGIIDIYNSFEHGVFFYSVDRELDLGFESFVSDTEVLVGIKVAVHDEDSLVSPAWQLSEFVSQVNGLGWQGSKNGKRTICFGNHDEEITKADHVLAFYAVVVAELNRGQSEIGIAAGIKGQIDTGRDGWNDEVFLGFPMIVDEEFQPLRSGIELSQIISVLERSWNIECVGDLRSRVDHEDGAVDDNIAWVSDADLRVFELDFHLSDPVSEIGHGDVQADIGAEAVIAFSPVMTGVRVAVHDEGCGISPSGEVAQAIAQGDDA